MAATSNNAINNTVGASISGVTNTLTIQNPSNTASSAAQMNITVGGTSSDGAWLQWTVGTTESFCLGANNSQSQKLYLNYTNSATISPTTGTNMFIYDHTEPGMKHAAGAYIVYNTAGGAVGTAANNGVSKYESGTWTPTIVGSGTAGSTGYSTQVGNYVLYGNQVYINFNIQISSATGTGDCTLSSLPFTSANDVLQFHDIRLAGNTFGWVASTTMACLGFSPNATTAIFNSAGSATAAGNIQLSNNGCAFSGSAVEHI